MLSLAFKFKHYIGLGFGKLPGIGAAFSIAGWTRSPLPYARMKSSTSQELGLQEEIS